MFSSAGYLSYLPAYLVGSLRDDTVAAVLRHLADSSDDERAERILAVWP
jgi:hypothetical protein